MIRFSALLVALAIGLLVAGVAASSLPLVYVSIAVCAVAALLLGGRCAAALVGNFRHRHQANGQPVRGQPGRCPARPPPAGPPSARPQPGSSWRSEAAAAQPGRAWLASGRTPGMAGFPGRSRRWPRPRPGRGPGCRAGARDRPAEADRAARGDRRPGARAGQPGARRSQPEQPAAAAEPIHAAATDDLWDRVNEELESAGKRDSGRLSWPAGDFSIPSGMSLPAEPPEPADARWPEPASGRGPVAARRWLAAAQHARRATGRSRRPRSRPAPGRRPGHESRGPELGPAAREAAAAEPAERDDMPGVPRLGCARPAGGGQEDEAQRTVLPEDGAQGRHAQQGSARDDTAQDNTVPSRTVPVQAGAQWRRVPGMRPARTMRTWPRCGRSGRRQARVPSPPWCPVRPP